MDVWLTRHLVLAEHRIALLQIGLERRITALLPGDYGLWLASTVQILILSFVGHVIFSTVIPYVLLLRRMAAHLAWTALAWGPAIVAAGLFFYCVRVSRHQWLRAEWCDFLSWQCTWISCKLFSGGAGDEEVCPICVEELPRSRWHFARLPCCRQRLCWPCVRRHAEGVIDDGRPEMLCPLLPCQKPVCDTVVQTAIRREQWSWPTLDFTGALARRKWRTYTQWSLTSGLAAACSARMEDVVHCPGADCGHVWLLPHELRRRKEEPEPKSWWNPRAWAVGRAVGLYSAPVGSRSGQDLRQLQCPKCRLKFCLLCGKPWSRVRPGSAAVTGVHDGKSCKEYSTHFPEDFSVGQRMWAGAKACPVCGVRIIRTAGCNHMTCTQCGGEWCWVCRSEWTPSHYGCTQRFIEDDCCIL